VQSSPTSSSTAPKLKPLPEGWIRRTPKKTFVEGAQGKQPGWLHALWVLTRHEFRSRYRAQALGVVWSLLNPLVMMGILSLIFTRIFRSAQPHFPIFFLIGQIVWQWVSNAAGNSAGAFVNHAEILKRTVFPRALLPLAVTLSYGLNFLIECTIVLLFIPIFPEAFRLSWALLLIPVVLFFLVLLLAGVSLMVSALNVIYRDVAYLVTTLLMIFYWLTPLIYPIEIVPEPFQTAFKCSPVVGMLGALRGIIMNGTAPTLLMWASIVVPTLIMFGIGWLTFKHYEQMVLDNV
jgi:ABC-type polysaccharide/polyol phosphate export permease